MSIESSFTGGGVVDKFQDLESRIGCIDAANPTSGPLAVAGKTFDYASVKNTSVCKTLLVTLEVQPKGGVAANKTFVVCPGEKKTIGYERDAINSIVNVEILDETVATPGAGFVAPVALAAPTAQDFAEDGGKITIIAELLNS